MQVNDFTKKIISQGLNSDINVEEFVEEIEKEDPYHTYFHSKVSYKNTIIYAYLIKERCAGGVPTVQEIRKNIEEKISDFDKIIKDKNQGACEHFIVNSLRIRYYEERYTNNQGKQVSWEDCENGLDNFVKEGFANRKEKNKSFFEVYDYCIKNFKEKVIKETKI